MKKLMSLILFTVTMLMSVSAIANIEIGRHVHFVLDATNADYEFKTGEGNCTGGVVPNGNGIAYGEITCVTQWTFLPWHNINDIATTLEYEMNSHDTANIQCELYDYSNNAGNNNGYNVTQYNSDTWLQTFKAVPNTAIGFGYTVTSNVVCFNGLQQ